MYSYFRFLIHRDTEDASKFKHTSNVPRRIDSTSHRPRHANYITLQSMHFNHKRYHFKAFFL
uniref:Putative ovule protein n=1 Tax=Solanum chacoense TaxID=4108 RepID=A0A0V0H678_SOLCH